MKKDLEIAKVKRARRGNLLREARVNKKMTKKELCKRLDDMDYRYLCSLEKGTRGLTLDMIEKIADIFGVQISDILKR